MGVKNRSATGIKGYHIKLTQNPSVCKDNALTSIILREKKYS
jgi:hypothetical protein